MITILVDFYYWLDKQYVQARLTILLWRCKYTRWQSQRFLDKHFTKRQQEWYNKFDEEGPEE